MVTTAILVHVDNTKGEIHLAYNPEYAFFPLKRQSVIKMIFKTLILMHREMCYRNFSMQTSSNFPLLTF